MGKKNGVAEGSGSVVKEVVLPMCGDGCSRQAAKGRIFLPGHDAKLAAMMQRIADGIDSIEDAPKLVQGRIKSGEYLLPSAKWETHEVTVTVRVRVAKGEGIIAAKELIQGRLAIRSISIVEAAAEEEVATV